MVQRLVGRFTVELRAELFLAAREQDGAVVAVDVGG